jgi:FlaA1/EpsC-like NDP-sugar epimerase
MGEQQAIYTLDMGEPVSIELLAEHMIRLAGKRPRTEVAIEYIGLRPGERLHETLFHPDERYSRTLHPGILQAMPHAAAAEQVELALQRLRAGVRDYDLAALECALRDAVSQFAPAAEGAEVQPINVVAFPGKQTRIH